MGRKSGDELKEQVRGLLANWDDCTELAKNPFARNPGVELIAATRYGMRVGTLARGLALRDLIRECLLDLEESLAGQEPIRTIVQAKLQGRTQEDTARSINISQEWLSRRYKKLLIALLLDALQSRLRLVREAAAHKAA